MRHFRNFSASFLQIFGYINYKSINKFINKPKAMKQIFTFILFSLYLSTITTQTIANLTGDWIFGWNTNPAFCCVPDEIKIVQNSTSNNFEAHFHYSSNYPFYINKYCQDNFISGSFNAKLSFTGYESDSEGLLTIEKYGWEDTEKFVNITQSSISSSVFSPLGPFIQVFVGTWVQCNFYIVPHQAMLSQNPSQQLAKNPLVYSPIMNMSAQGFNGTSNQTADSCCMPKFIFKSFDMSGRGNTSLLSYIQLNIDYSEENLSNIWCAGDSNSNSKEINFLPTYYNDNISIWNGLGYGDFQIIVDNNYPGYLQAIYFGYSDSICTFNVTNSEIAETFYSRV